MYKKAKADSDECFVTLMEFQKEVNEKDLKIIELEVRLKAEADESAKKILELEVRLKAEADESAKKIIELEAKVKKYEDAEYAYNQKFKQPKEAVYDSDDEPLLPFKHLGKRVR